MWNVISPRSMTTFSTADVRPVDVSQASSASATSSYQPPKGR